MRESSVPQKAVERVHPPRWVIKKLVNPVARRVLLKDRGQMSDNILLLHYRGRRSGTAYDVPVGYRIVNGRVALFTNSGWRHNFEVPLDVEVTIRGERRGARAELLDDPGAVAAIYERLIDEMGLEDASRQLGIKINVDRKPTHEELAGMARESGLSIVWLDVRTEAAVA